MDVHSSIRSLSFPSLASALGINLKHFKQRSNGEHYGPCPIHKSKHNQTCFSYHPDGRFNCFSCSAKGRGGIDLAMKIRAIGFKEAVEMLSDLKTPEPSPTKGNEPIEAPITSGEVLKPFTGKYHHYKVECDWLNQRIPDAGVRERYGVFCYNNKARKSAYSNRVMIPVRSLEGVVYGYLARKWSTECSDTAPAADPKYFWPKGFPKSRFLFGAHEILAGTFGSAPLRRVWLVESPFCVMKFAMWGIPACSAYGWSPSDEQIAILATLTRGCVFLPDRNKRAEASPAMARLAQRLWVRFPELPDGTQDPEHLTKEQLLLL